MSSARSDAQAPLLAIILLNWNGWRESVIGIASLLDQAYSNYSLVILDNGSTDGSADYLAEWLQGRGAAYRVAREERMVAPSCVVWAEGRSVTLLRNATNDGFAGGNNIAIRYALESLHPDYVFLLNSDAILDSQCLQRCVDLAREHNGAIVGAVVKGADRTTVLFTGADPLRELFFFSAPSPESELPGSWETGRVEGSGELIDAGFLRERCARWGYYLDPRLFMYCEDSDLALSARRLGRKILMTSAAVVYHGVAQSSGGPGNPMQYYYLTRNRIFLARRWLPPLGKIFFHAYYAPTRIARLIQRYLQGRPEVALAIWQGLSDGYRGRSGKWGRQ